MRNGHIVKSWFSNRGWFGFPWRIKLSNRDKIKLVTCYSLDLLEYSFRLIRKILLIPVKKLNRLLSIKSGMPSRYANLYDSLDGLSAIRQEWDYKAQEEDLRREWTEITDQDKRKIEELLYEKMELIKQKSELHRTKAKFGELYFIQFSRPAITKPSICPAPADSFLESQMERMVYESESEMSQIMKMPCQKSGYECRWHRYYDYYSDYSDLNHAPKHPRSYTIYSQYRYSQSLSKKAFPESKDNPLFAISYDSIYKLGYSLDTGKRISQLWVNGYPNIYKHARIPFSYALAAEEYLHEMLRKIQFVQPVEGRSEYYFMSPYFVEAFRVALHRVFLKTLDHKTGQFEFVM